VKVHRIQGIAFSSYLIETPDGRAFSPPTQVWTRAVQRLATNALPLLRLPGIAASVAPADGERLDRFGLPGALYYTPGHSEWCVSLVLDDGTTFAGDLIIGAGHMTRVVAPPAMATDPIGALDSMRKLLRAGAKRFMPAHGREFSANDVRDMLRRLRGRRRPRDAVRRPA